MSSPARRQSIAHRPTYTHQQNRISTHKFQSISQKSPVIDSPRLNQQIQAENPKNQLNTELKTKLEIVLKHNSQLLNENATLSEMVNSLRMQVEVLRRENEARSIEMGSQLNRVIQQLKQSQLSHQLQIAKLLDQIGLLHKQSQFFGQQKNKQIKHIKQNHDRQLTLKINQLKRSSDQSKDILELQIKKLKEAVQLKNFQIDSLKIQIKCEIDRLLFENKNLNNQIQHLNQLKNLQIRQILNEQKDKTNLEIKTIEKQKQLQIRKAETNNKKLQNQLNQKYLEVMQARKQGAAEVESLHDQLASAKNQKVMLLEELNDAKQSAAEKLNREKDRLKKIAELDEENLNSIILSERALLKGERQKVILLCNQKTHQIKRLYEIINEQKQTFESQKNTLQHLLNQFRQKLKDIELQNKEQLELLKIKMTQLHEGDIKALESYYENQVRNLIRQNKIIAESHEADRNKLHKALQDNDEIRKNFQIEITKQKAKLQDMKVKFAAAHVEFKEQITSLGTKMQLTSHTLLRQTEQKQKGAEFFEAQKKKFYRIIEEKDKQIIAIQQTMSKLKEISDEQISQLHSQISIIRDSLIAKDQQFKEFKANLESEFERKSLKIIEETQRIDPDEKIIQENIHLRENLVQLEKQNFKKTKQVQFLHRENKSLQAELGLRAGFIETLQLESSAAIEDEKSKVKVLMNQSEVAMKDYYQSKLQSKEKDIEHLKKQVTEKDYDLRAVISKYNTVQKKLKQLLDAQSKLSDFENKIIHLGLDQNLVKNLAELFKKHKD